MFNLLMINERLSEIFFKDQLEFCYHMIECEEERFVAHKSELEKFVKTILAKNVKAFDEEAKAANWHFTMNEEEMNTDIN